MCKVLSKRLAPGWHPTVKTVLLETLEGQIRSTSEIVVRGSLLVNEVLHWYLSRPVEEQVALPKLDQSLVTVCFTRGLEVRPGRAWNEGYRGVIEEMFQDKFTNYPFARATTNPSPWRHSYTSQI